MPVRAVAPSLYYLASLRDCVLECSRTLLRRRPDPSSAAASAMPFLQLTSSTSTYPTPRSAISHTESHVLPYNHCSEAAQSASPRAAVATTLVEQTPFCETTMLPVAVSQTGLPCMNERPPSALSSTRLQAEHTVSVPLQPLHLQHASRPDRHNRSQTSAPSAICSTAISSRAHLVCALPPTHL